MFGADSHARPIVLVHGAWVGEWSWNPVLPLLHATGRPVHAVSLTGHGTRRHQSGPHITLSDHVADVVNVLEVLDLVGVTLVGHSYGGRVISRVWKQSSARIARLLYLDAHAPVAGDSGQSPERTAVALANGGMLPFAGYDPDPAIVGGSQGVAWFMDRVMPQSFATFTEQVEVTLPPDLDKTFVLATKSESSRFTGYADVIRLDLSWSYIDLAGPHWLMYSHPNEIAQIISSR